MERPVFAAVTFSTRSARRRTLPNSYSPASPSALSPTTDALPNVVPLTVLDNGVGFGGALDFGGEG